MFEKIIDLTTDLLAPDVELHQLVSGQTFVTSGRDTEWWHRRSRKADGVTTVFKGSGNAGQCWLCSQTDKILVLIEQHQRSIVDVCVSDARGSDLQVVNFNSYSFK